MSATEITMEVAESCPTCKSTREFPHANLLTDELCEDVFHRPEATAEDQHATAVAFGCGEPECPPTTEVTVSRIVNGATGEVTVLPGDTVGDEPPGQPTCLGDWITRLHKAGLIEDHEALLVDWAEEQCGTSPLPPDIAKPVLACGRWRNNAEMFVDVERLYIRPRDVVVDVTYGKGAFWRLVRPLHLTEHDADTSKGDGVRWDNLPEADRSVNVVVMDPEYVSRGGRETSTLGSMIGAYGMDDADKTPEGLWADILTGIEEAARVLKNRGLLLLKVMPYVSGGRYKNIMGWIERDLPQFGYSVEDVFILPGNPGPQPKTNLDGTERKQVHARNNASYLVILRVRHPKARKP